MNDDRRSKDKTEKNSQLNYIFKFAVLRIVERGLFVKNKSSLFIKFHEGGV